MTHPTREQLERWRDAGGEVEREPVLGHLAACEACRLAYVELVRTRPAITPAPETTFDPQAFVARGRDAYDRANARGFRWTAAWIGLPSAAAAALTVALLLPSGQPRPSVAPSSPPIEVRGSDVEGLAPVGDVVSVTEFRWSSPYAATRYRLAVRDSSGTVVLTAETSASRYAVPPDDTPRLRGGRYSWTVEALDANGRTIASSRPRSFSFPR